MSHESASVEVSASVGFGFASYLQKIILVKFVNNATYLRVYLFLPLL